MAGVNVRVNVQVHGLGPKFILRIFLQNAGSSPLLGSKIIFSYDSTIYVVKSLGGVNHSIPVSILLPGPKHCFEAEVVCIDSQGRAGQIILMLSSAQKDGGSRYVILQIYTMLSTALSSVPLLSASVKMPSSELLS